MGQKTLQIYVPGRLFRELKPELENARDREKNSRESKVCHLLRILIKNFLLIWFKIMNIKDSKFQKSNSRIAVRIKYLFLQHLTNDEFS